MNTRTLVSETQKSRLYEVRDGDGNLVGTDEEFIVEKPHPSADQISAITKWRGMGFSDAEIVAMYPHLAYAVEHSATN